MTCMLHSPPSYNWPFSCTDRINGTVLSCTFPYPLLLLSLSTTDPHRQLQGKTYDWAKSIHFKLCMTWCVWWCGGGDEGWNLKETKPSHHRPIFCHGYLTSLPDMAVGFSRQPHLMSVKCETCKGGHFNLSQKVLQYNPITHHCLCRIALLNASIVLAFHLSYSLPPYTIPDHHCVYKPLILTHLLSSKYFRPNVES